MLNIEDSTAVETFYTLLSSFGLHPRITFPTRFFDNSASLIDNIFYKALSHQDISGIMTYCFSDHQPYFCILKNFKLKVHCKQAKFVTVKTSLDKECFKAEVEKLNFDNILQGNDIHECTSNLIETLSSVKEKLCPVKLVKFNKYKYKIQPWMTNGINQSRKIRDKMYEKWLKTPRNSNKSSKLKDEIRTYNRILRKCMRQAEKNYHFNFCNKFQYYF